jgi:hypothetical protein
MGKLNYSDNAEYILIQDDGNEINISKELDKIYMSDDNGVEFQVRKGVRLLHDESGLLIKKKNKNGFYSYHINGYFDLDLELFNLVGERIEILLTERKTSNEKKNEF